MKPFQKPGRGSGPLAQGEGARDRLQIVCHVDELPDPDVEHAGDGLDLGVADFTDQVGAGFEKGWSFFEQPAVKAQSAFIGKQGPGRLPFFDFALERGDIGRRNIGRIGGDTVDPARQAGSVEIDTSMATTRAFSM